MLAPGTQAISGTGARCAIGEAAYLLGAWEAGELALGPTHSLARSHLSGYHGANSARSRLFTLGRLLSRRCAVVNNLLDLPRRLLWVEVSMMCVLLFMGLWQIHYLKRYFQTKKLI